MASPGRLPLGRLFAVGLLTFALCAVVLYIYVGWAPLVGEGSFILNRSGYVAMGLGLAAALTLGAGLAALILAGRRRD
ncbi:MAG: hypothetical protein JOY64_25760 [Alphaproteobacteria bacterium]|nr:hypothetical protein [Alphaproteobacteria bacterium]